ncbi:hypothetical protein MG293_009968 [Ovis ammon polii]|uniref:Uncharacterized protein n=1 Tax=Ovis ammon polii TaxID=230172 RepID=A0AAD4U4Z6_OVIAM|nr:hypothetical protein MG293_009968 [Ovis ammon polii]
MIFLLGLCEVIFTRLGGPGQCLSHHCTPGIRGCADAQQCLEELRVSEGKMLCRSSSCGSCLGAKTFAGPTEWPQITYQNTRQNFNKEKFLSRHSSVGFDSPSAKGEKKHVDPDHVL